MTEIGDVAEVVAGATRALGFGEQAGVPLRVFGGAAVAMTCPSAHRPPLRRGYGDIDLVTSSRHRGAVTEAFERAGMAPDQAFNSLHAADRLWFWDSFSDYKVEVFFDRISMCHTLELGDRFDVSGEALPVADLLLLKLQIVALADKDLKDATALLVDHEIGPAGIDAEEIGRFLARDWGWWRTATGSLRTIREWAREQAGANAAAGPDLGIVPGRVDALLEAIEAADKSRRWRMRARIGERMRWYEEPDEVGG